MAEPDVEMGKRIERFRVELGLNQALLARLCGVSVTTVRNWERGHPPDRSMRRLATVLHRTPAEILGDVEAEPLDKATVLEVMRTHRHQLGEDERRASSPEGAPPEAAPG